jgi:molybdate transport system substrate-binding protein
MNRIAAVIGGPARLKVLILTFAVIASSIVAAAQEITVAAAADLSNALQEVANHFQAQTGKRVKLSFGSSGNFFTAIRNGAPFDVFFSADVDYPKKLEAAGLAEPGSLYPYAVGRIVVWVPNSSNLDVRRGLSLADDPLVKRIAIANPKHAPYGRAAESALQSTGIYERVSQKLVVGENVSQAAQFVQTGNADLGIIALSLALSPAMSGAGRYYVVPDNLYPPLLQAAVIMKAARDKATARQFMSFLRSQPAADILARYGFNRPQSGHQ